MTTRTRYFMTGAALVLVAGLCTGLIAYYGGFPALSASKSGPNELSYIPADAAVVAYADVHAVMTSQFRQKLHDAMPANEREGRDELQQKTGIDIERDIQYVIAGLGPQVTEPGTDGGGLVIARGNFDTGRLEALAREHDGTVEQYRGLRLVIGAMGDHPREPGAKMHKGEGAMAFLEPGLVALGDVASVKRAIDAHNDGKSVSGNDEMMRLVADIEAGSNAWAVGRFDALRNRERLPEQVSNQLSSVKWFAATGHINGGLSGTLRAEARDEQAADNLRDVVRGLLALAKLQGGSDPRAAAMVNSLQLTGTGKTVVLSFAVPAEVVDLLAGAAKEHHREMRAPEPPRPPAPPKPPTPDK
jgi:hypothetical protein